MKIQTFINLLLIGIFMFIGSLLKAQEKVQLHLDNFDNLDIISSIAEHSSQNVFVESPSNSYSSQDSVFFADDAYETEMFRLRNLQSAEIPIRSLPLYSVIKLCAESSKMNYLAPDKEDFSEIVSLNVQASPFEVLELLAQTYCFGMDFKSGIWRFYRININELVTRSYKIKYNTNEIISTTSPSIKPEISGGNTSNVSKAETTVFTKQKDELMELVKKILEMPSTDIVARIDKQIDVDSTSKIQDPTFTPKHSKELPQLKGNFYFSSDNNELIVTASRQQHSLIEQYIKTIDKPQKLIKIQAIIVETSKNPRRDFGVDWSKAGKATFELTNIANSNNNLTDIMNSGFVPNVATLSVSDMAVTLNFLNSDKDTNILQDPVVVTSNNREVALKSVTQQPIESGSASSTTLTTSNTANSIDYIEIGTLINIFPKILSCGIKGYDKEAVKMEISIVISSQVGTQEIDGNSFPIVSSRTYTYSVVVPSGYTLAIGGLSECIQSTRKTKLPILGDIPILGAAFRSKSQINDKRNLLAFITPTIIDSVINDDIGIVKRCNKSNPFDELHRIDHRITR